MLALLLSVAALLPLAAAVDCNACGYSCKWWDASCAAKKQACFATGSPVATWASSVEAACSNWPGRVDAQPRIEEAKDLLIKHGTFTRGEFDGVCAGVQIRWCDLLDRGSALGFTAVGMAPSAGKILLHSKFQDTSLEDLVVLLAHEMCHIRQHRRWGRGGFYCRYVAPADPSLTVEDECYSFDRSAKVPRCFTVKNLGGSTVYAAFMYFSHARNAWMARGWYTALAYDSTVFCVARREDATLLVHFYNGGSYYSKYAYSSGDDSALCIADTRFQTVYNYKGYTYYDAVGELRGDSCGDASGYWLARFEHMSGGADEYVYDNAEVGARRLLLQQDGVGGEGAGGYGEYGDAEELEVAELSEEEVEAVMHEGPGGRKVVYVDSEEDDMSDMTDVA